MKNFTQLTGLTSKIAKLNPVYILAVCLFVFTFTNTLKAQKLITVQHGSTASFFSTLDSALAAAVTGDYVYIPGGVWNLAGYITVGANIVGAGCLADSTGATGITQITGSNYGNYIMITAGSSNGSITGVQFMDPVVLGGDNSRGNTTVNNYTLTRCRFSSGWFRLSWNGNGGATSQNLLLSENIFDQNIELQGGYISGATITKNFFFNDVNYFYNCNFSNNVFAINNTWKVYNTSNSSFSNNIDYDNSGNNYFMHSSCSNNALNNNIFNDPDQQGEYNNTEINDLYKVDTVFVNFTGFNYDIHANYHLAAGSRGHNYGTDGTDVGVYGTLVPFKDGLLPYNPHIQLQSIGTSTDSKGHLPVNIRVDAQNN